MFTILGGNISSIFKSPELCKLFKFFFYFDQLVEMEANCLPIEQKTFRHHPAACLLARVMWPTGIIMKADRTTATNCCSIILQCTDVAANAVGA